MSLHSFVSHFILLKKKKNSQKYEISTVPCSKLVHGFALHIIEKSAEIEIPYIHKFIYMKIKI